MLDQAMEAFQVGASVFILSFMLWLVVGSTIVYFWYEYISDSEPQTEAMSFTREVGEALSSVVIAAIVAVLLFIGVTLFGALLIAIA